jgi:microcin C transport system substrate-binding protein
MIRQSLCATVLALLWGGCACAETGPNGGQLAHGIAMHGDLKFAADFAHFDHVNALAPKGGRVRFGEVGSFDSLNPYIVKGRAAAGAGALIDPLMKRNWNEPFSLYCLICETVELPEDRSWIAFTLRPEARFHDGLPITVDDVLWSSEMLKEQGTPGKRTIHGRVSAVERQGERGVKFTFAPGTSRETALLIGDLPVFPKHAWAALPFDETFITARLGSGAYKVKSVDPGRSIEYERVPDYWAKDLPVNRGFDNFDLIRYDYYRDDGVALEAFLAGAYDVRREFNEDRWATQYDTPKVVAGDIIKGEFAYSHPAWMKGFFLNQRRAFFQDRRVRMAMSYAFDFEWMNSAYFHGAQKRLQSWFAASELAATGTPSPAELALLEPFRAQLPDEVFGPALALPATDGSGPRGLRDNLRQADRLLREAGYIVADGKRVDAAGTPVSISVLYTSASDEPTILEWGKTLARLGIAVVPQRVDSSVYIQRANTYDFDVTVNRLLSTLSPGTEQKQRYHGSIAADTEGTRNWHGVKDPVIDALTDYVADSASRSALVTAVHALDRVLMNQWLIVPWGYVPSYRIAYAAFLRHPAEPTLYGAELTTWWAAP